MRFTPYACLFTLLTAGTAVRATPLSELAGNMQPGQWAKLPTQNLPQVLADGGASGHCLPFSDGAAWDPTSRRVFYIGGDHDGDSERFLSWTDNGASTWVREPHPWVLSGSVNQNHSYDYQAIDTAGGYYYYRTDRYDISAGTWSEITESGLPSFHRGHSAWEYFPGKGLVAIGDGGVWLLADGASTRRTLAERAELDYTGPINTDPVAEYNPVHDVLIFGGGDESNTLYKMGRDETFTRLGTPPIAEISCGPWGTVLTVDPVSGMYLALDKAANFYQYDVTTDTWALLTDQPQPVPHFDAYFLDSTKINNVVATPVSTYGVTLFVMWNYDESAVWLYKHAPFDGPPDGDVIPDPPQNVAVE